jgi:glycosyltransferase involved in cell wall biosynthesis
MKIALVSPTPVPKVYGGMDRLLDGLAHALRKHFATDLVTVPVDERSNETLLQGYYDFYHLDLSQYDIVISTKAPAYMVQHPVHILYLCHRLRVFYDLYEPRNSIHTRMRRLIHWMDNWAMDRERISEVFCLGRTVSRRLLKWGGISSTPLHPPTTFEPVEPRQGQHFLAVGRLHEWKRFDLIIKSFISSRAQAPLLIVGAGPEEVHLKEIASHDTRIKFLGHVDENKLEQLYADSIAQIFTPINEDLGLVTWESFLSGKPVLTTEDSGEPSLIVEHGKTGFITMPTPNALAERINWMDQNREKTARMKHVCREKVGEITWDRVVDRLLEAALKTFENKKAGNSGSRPPGALPKISRTAATLDQNIHLLVTDNQMIDPPVGGGRIRIWELYRNLPADFITTYIGTHDHPGPQFRDQWMAPNFREIVMPLTMLHFRAHEIWRRLTRGKATIDVTIPLLLSRCSPRYHRLIAEHVEQADIYIHSHPWMQPFIPPGLDLPVIYDSHNCESGLKKDLLGHNLAGRYLARKVEQIERNAVRHSDRILACSPSDSDQFKSRFGCDREKIILVPNGVDCDRICPPRDAGAKSGLKHQLSLPDRPLAIFVGSDYAPNLDATDYLIRQVAPAMPELTIGIVGGAGPAWTRRFDSDSPPANVWIFGVVDSDRLVKIYKAADIGLNPMTQGSGTNIKMLDYMAAGLPILTTETGARGLNGEDGSHWIQVDIFEFIASLKSLNAREDLHLKLGIQSRELAESVYDWKCISSRLADELRHLVQAHKKNNRQIKVP